MYGFSSIAFRDSYLMITCGPFWLNSFMKISILLQKMIKDFFFIPADPLAAESFSEYPFYLELMPESILSQKIELLFADALKLSPQISGRSIFYKIFERMRLKKLSKYLKSPYDVRVRAVFAFVAVTQGSFFI